MEIMSKEIIAEKGLYNSTSTIFQVVAVTRTLTIRLSPPSILNGRRLNWQDFSIDDARPLVIHPLADPALTI